MNNVITIDEVVRRTGLTSRSLRFYEARGLLQTNRSLSGKRLFGPAELERVHQIMLLKRAGLTVAQMQQLFDRKAIDIVSLLRGQLESLSRQAAAISASQSVIRTVLDQSEEAQPLTVSAICALIKHSAECASPDPQWRAVIDRYWSEDAKTEWQTLVRPVFAQHPEWANGGYLSQWRTLSEKIKTALPLDPSSEQARDFVQEWLELLAPIMNIATPNMRANMVSMYSDMSQWPQNVDHGFDKSVWDFVRAAHQAATLAGHVFVTPPSPHSSQETF